jgi:hypothetical protein
MNNTPDWIELLLQDCLIGGCVRLQDFPDIRASIAWTAEHSPSEVLVERFVLDRKWAKGPKTHFHIRNPRWANARDLRDFPKSWEPTIKGGALLNEIGNKRPRSRVWMPFHSLPVLLHTGVFGVLAIEARIESIQEFLRNPQKSDGERYQQPTGRREDDLAAPLHSERERYRKTNGWHEDNLFAPLHSLAAAAAYIRLWQNGTRNRDYARAVLTQLVRAEERDALKASDETELPNPRQIYEIAKRNGFLATHSSRIQIINATPRILDLLRDSPEQMSRLNPAEFENLIANRLDRMGFDVVATGAVYSPDGGIDLIATPKQRNLGSFLLAAQVKHHATGRPVTREDVDRLLSWKDSVFRLGLLVTNTQFTAPARWIAQQERNRHFLRLREFSDLKRWLYDNFDDDAEWSELPSFIELAPGVSIEIPKPTLSSELTQLHELDGNEMSHSAARLIP